MTNWTKEQEAEIQARCDAATEGEWEFDRFSDYTVRADNWGIVAKISRHDARSEFLAISEANAEFIAHARTDLPDALDEIKRLRAEVEGGGA